MNLVSNLFFKIVSHIIACFFPSYLWYKTAFYVTNYSKKFCYAFRDRKLSDYQKHGNQLDKLLSLLTRKNTFAIQYSIDTSKVTKDTINQGEVYCTSHLPLTKVAIRAFIENEKIIDYALIGSNTKNNLFSIWGSSVKIKTLIKSPYVLLKSKRILEQNKSIVLMIDDPKNGFYSPNMLKIIGKTNSKLILFYTYFKKNGKIITEFLDPPYPYCLTDYEIEANIEFLKNLNNNIICNKKTI
jgi:hypothetical protein